MSADVYCHWSFPSSFLALLSVIGGGGHIHILYIKLSSHNTRIEQHGACAHGSQCGRATPTARPPAGPPEGTYKEGRRDGSTRDRMNKAAHSLPVSPTPSRSLLLTRSTANQHLFVSSTARSRNVTDLSPSCGGSRSTIGPRPMLAVPGTSVGTGRSSGCVPDASNGR